MANLLVDVYIQPIQRHRLLVYIRGSIMDYQDFNIFSANATTNPRQEKGLVLGSGVNILGA
jgi:hypothetical protein